MILILKNDGVFVCCNTNNQVCNDMHDYINSLMRNVGAQAGYFIIIINSIGNEITLNVNNYIQS